MLFRHCYSWLCVLLVSSFVLAQKQIKETDFSATSLDQREPWKRVLAGEDKACVKELENQITELVKQSKYSEAISLAETVLETTILQYKERLVENFKKTMFELGFHLG